MAIFTELSIMRDRRRSLEGYGRILPGGEEVLLEQKQQVNLPEGIYIGFDCSTGTYLAGNPATTPTRTIQVGFYENGLRLYKANTREEWRKTVDLTGNKTCLKLTNVRKNGNLKVSIFLPSDIDFTINGAGQVRKVLESIGAPPVGYTVTEVTEIDLGALSTEAISECQAPASTTGGGRAPIVWSAG